MAASSSTLSVQGSRLAATQQRREPVPKRDCIARQNAPQGRRPRETWKTIRIDFRNVPVVAAADDVGSMNAVDDSWFT